jgi:hypothetical protein
MGCCGGGSGSLLELGQGGRVGCFYAGAVSFRAGDLCVGAVVVAHTVGGGGVLAEELELVEGVGCHRCGEVSMKVFN